jgi:polysaccharide export outer membrane protein
LKHINLLLLIVVASISMLAGSCTSYKNIPYFKDVPDSGYVYKNGVQVPVTAYQAVRIQPNDILSVDIRTIDPEVNEALRNPNSQMTRPLTNENDAASIGYLVDEKGNIELPVAGTIKVGGLTTAEAKEAVRQKALAYYKEPIVNVRIINFKVTVLGEVTRPGTYLINGEKATILDALGQAGDMSIFGTRTNVLLSRNENGQQKMIRFNLTETEMFSSPYFYLRQGDVLYVQPTKGKAAANDGAALRTYTIITSTLSLLAIVISRL